MSNYAVKITDVLKVRYAAPTDVDTRAEVRFPSHVSANEVRQVSASNFVVEMPIVQAISLSAVQMAAAMFVALENCVSLLH